MRKMRIVCKLLGHKPIVTKKRVYCKRCGKNGFMQRIIKDIGEIIEYGI